MIEMWCLQYLVSLEENHIVVIDIAIFIFFIEVKRIV